MNYGKHLKEGEELIIGGLYSRSYFIKKQQEAPEERLFTLNLREQNARRLGVRLTNVMRAL